MSSNGYATENALVDSDWALAHLDDSNVRFVEVDVDTTAYPTAKHGVVGLTKSVASELAPLGIRVNAVAPGNTVTAMTSAVITGDPNDTARAEAQMARGSALGIAGMPSDIAYALLYLASDEARNVTAHTLVVDAGQTSAIGRTVFHDGKNEVIREAGKRGN